ncbi:upper zone of growth plate and cartilage matrix associated a [Thalassophryne amazonica]|uniref:upper zone of growth plate and cartilage matrix associated a n=1 Tax=Thalassophryne amazonica TaxID=390379 RepID=UPI00147190B1|nr:upper zone of growth plate and cartilage matrix associated a [Thalassophryne amazonica]
MSWTRVIVISLFTALLILAISRLADSASVRGDTDTPESKGAERQVFMPEADASNFFKRRTRRSFRYYDEHQAEQRVRQAANERRREYNEEQRNEYENYTEELLDEQNERTREVNEQYREFHYDGLYPRRHWFF